MDRILCRSYPGSPRNTEPNPPEPICHLKPSVAASRSAYVNQVGRPGMSTSSSRPSLLDGAEAR
jgi:hypothetical protein